MLESQLPRIVDSLITGRAALFPYSSAGEIRAAAGMVAVKGSVLCSHPGMRNGARMLPSRSGGLCLL